MFNGKLGLICWYKKIWLEEATLPQLIRMFDSHGNAVDDKLATVKWNQDKILNMITRAIDLDADVNNSINRKEDINNGEVDHVYSDLLFETIRNMYHVDRNSMVTDPEKFEQILIKMLGKGSYEEISNNIKNSFIKEIFGYFDNLASSLK